MYSVPDQFQSLDGSVEKDWTYFDPTSDIIITALRLLKREEVNII